MSSIEYFGDSRKRAETFGLEAVIVVVVGNFEAVSDVVVALVEGRGHRYLRQVQRWKYGGQGQSWSQLGEETLAKTLIDYQDLQLHLMPYNQEVVGSNQSVCWTCCTLYRLSDASFNNFLTKMQQYVPIFS